MNILSKYFSAQFLDTDFSGLQDVFLSPQRHIFGLDLGISLICFSSYFGTAGVLNTGILRFIFLQIDYLALCTVCCVSQFDVTFLFRGANSEMCVLHHCVFPCNDSIFWTDWFILFIFKWELARYCTKLITKREFCPLIPYLQQSEKN